MFTRALPGTTQRTLSAVAARAADEYSSRFRNWDQRASVRTKPRRTLDGADRSRLFFPPELTPVMAHPLVPELAAGPVGHLLVHRLYQYLHFTTELEAVAVMPVTLKLSLGHSGLALSGAMRTDAFKITTDEAWHAQFSHDLITQVHHETGVPPRLPRVPQFAKRLEALRRTAGPGLGHLCDLVFAVVSETLISAILSDIPKDTRLRGAVRDLVADHAEDEGRHHSYFRSLLTYLWPALGERERRALGPLVPDLVRCFLEPDYAATSYALLDLGVPEHALPQVIAESYPAEQVTRDIGAAARSTVRYFQEVGALDEPATRDAFVAAGLL
jgi:P-aminobenzoate N-oxygenase AurF